VSAPVTRVVLREQVKELILERILNGSYRPGERLVETRIAAELGTSQAPVREALRDLELLRFIESTPFRGAREVSQEELLEIYPVRAAIEEVAAREAATRLDGNVGALAAELEAMHQAADANDLHTQVEHDVAFHRLIVEASGNRTCSRHGGRSASRHGRSSPPSEQASTATRSPSATGLFWRRCAPATASSRAPRCAVTSSNTESC
jgi:DNA-binding GntR family transcriptional regulator